MATKGALFLEVVMTIAGSDSSGGTGVQADLKTFQELGVVGTSVITAVTAHNTLGMDGLHPIPADFVAQQMLTVFRDMRVKAIKTGLLYSSEIIKEVAASLIGKDIPIIVDPEIISTSGTVLLQKDAVETLKTHLLPLAKVVTVSVPEASMLSQVAIHEAADVKKAVEAIVNLGAQCVVIKGGKIHKEKAIDTIYFANGQTVTIASPRIQTVLTQGSGCTFSAAITAYLAQDYSLSDAIVQAKQFIQAALLEPLHIGKGQAQVNHFAYRRLQEEIEVSVIKE